MPLKDYTADQLLLCQQLKRKLYLGRITAPMFVEQLLLAGLWPERIALELHDVMWPMIEHVQGELRRRFEAAGETATADQAA